MNDSTPTRPDQFYLFTMPGDMCPVWAEMFLGDGTHVVAPTPHSDMSHALSALHTLHPDATVDELDDPAELAEVRTWAATMPLEQVR